MNREGKEYIHIRYKVLVGKSERKRPLGRARHRQVDNIKIDLRETEWTVLILIKMRPVEGFCEHSNESNVSIKCWEFLK
jgi:hypothetical protein